MGFVGAEPQLEPGNCVRAKSSGVSTIAGHETFSFAAVDGSHEYVVKSTAPTGERFGKMSVKDLKGSATGKAMAFEEMTAAEVTEWKKPLALYTDRDLELTCSQTVIK